MSLLRAARFCWNWSQEAMPIVRRPGLQKRSRHRTGPGPKERSESHDLRGLRKNGVNRFFRNFPFIDKGAGSMYFSRFAVPTRRF
jgi:hypothetical protein